MNRVAKFFSSEKFGRGAEGKIPNSRMNFVIDEGGNYFSAEKFSPGIKVKTEKEIFILLMSYTLL